MIRLALFVSALCLSVPEAYSQFTVSQNEKGQLLTTVDVYGPGKINATSYNKITYLGSPFLNYPVWQPGTIQIDRSGKEIPCQLAYNLVTNEVLFRFDETSAVKIITPDLFKINDTEYIRQNDKSLGVDHHLYVTTIHNGPTQLLTCVTKRLANLNSSEAVNNTYNRDLNVEGIYRTKTTYYIRKGDARPELISLTKKSLLEIFREQAQQLANRIPDKALTTLDIIHVINAYDSLMVIARSGTYPLNHNPLFIQSLQDKIIYPNWAGSQGVYGRVYAGFDIDSLGKVKNVALLSPNNAGFGLAQGVLKALDKLPVLDPAYKGTYVLPVAFTYTNSLEKAGTHVPINQLPDERMGNRIVLAEFVVPYVVSKQTITAKEVWGYYR
ncbi:hypothetical protein [Spirosoma agri]|uniref:TonB C-terminal domain-containing protein n=1 Tax=Spirosoma agri TaxID=1987381 RepID=A0A6M0INV7_9BACT|nr:hypothetical protein [Spirosoma agri]NEU69976.1 hypothetical protein [Spirosoma agri]